MRFLVEHMVREDFATFVAALAKVGSIADPLERLWKLGVAYVEFALANPHHYRLLFMTPHPPEQHAEDEPTGIEGYRFLRSTVAACIDAGLMRPEITDVDMTAQAIWSTTHGLVSLHIAMGHLSKFNWRAPTMLMTSALGATLRGFLRSPASLEQLIGGTRRAPAEVKRRP